MSTLQNVKFEMSDYSNTTVVTKPTFFCLYQAGINYTFSDIKSTLCYSKQLEILERKRNVVCISFCASDN